MFKCSHIVCKVDNLSKVVKDFKELGFNIEWGSNPDKAHNALIWFEKGPFIEFYQPPKILKYFSFFIGAVWGSPMKNRLTGYLNMKNGWCDAAFERFDYDENSYDENNKNLFSLKKNRIDFKKAGIKTSRIAKGSRVRLDGKKVKYSVFIPEPHGWPFIVSGYNFPQRPKKIEHENGAKEVVSMKIGVLENNLNSFEAFYKKEPILKTEASDKPGIINVEISGLSSELDSKLLHGARILQSA